MAEIPFDNVPIQGWGKKNLASVKSAIGGFGIKHSIKSRSPAPLANRIFVKFRKKDGFIYKIAYSIPKTGIYVHKGVSRGHKISNPREAKKFFDQPTDANLPELQDIVADMMGSYVINNIKIK